ncbi:unnamed protein product [Bursaphelenchus okinawaensis]|uniref:Talin N-terminal F0 domain-containing protein n=1 Tax=Bursaphelenchus okinawaensis TaxID=465554 RepID=A0A811JQ24_9BILA|nr:unnamed protein product [Bursaphelenchus okinawaensis]CAG9077193.1 unnamed protein product [Bursaphelenchus okinawaensis]
MVAITLDIVYQGKGVRKTMKFEPSNLVQDVIRIAKDKVGASGAAHDYGLIRLDEDPSKSYWLEGSKPLDYYLLRNNVNLHFYGFWVG